MRGAGGEVGAPRYEGAGHHHPSTEAGVEAEWLRGGGEGGVHTGGRLGGGWLHSWQYIKARNYTFFLRLSYFTTESYFFLFPPKLLSEVR